MRRILASAALGALWAGAAAAEPIDCAAPMEQTVGFTAPDAADTLVLTVRGEDCESGGTMSIEIFSASGALVYSDSWAQGQFYDWEHERPMPAANAMAMSDPKVEPMPDYPAGAAILADPDLIEGDFYVIADPDDFDRANAADAPVACYLTSPYEARCAWFDPEAGVAYKLYGYAG